MNRARAFSSFGGRSPPDFLFFGSSHMELEALARCVGFEVG
jgi:hypothetical protein